MLRQPIKRCAQVRFIGHELREEGAQCLCVCQWPQGLREAEKKPGMGRASLSFFLRLQPLQPELTHGLQHPQPRLAVETDLAPEQTLINE
jgi:hypothetical protein